MNGILNRAYCGKVAANLIEAMFPKNKAGYTATEVACGWARAIFEVTRPFGQERWGQKDKNQ